jgi:hypothetical protein
VLFSSEAFLLRRSNDAAVFNQSRRAVVIEGRDAENAHVSGQRVDRWRRAKDAPDFGEQIDHQN